MNQPSVSIKDIYNNTFFNNNIHLMAGRDGLFNKVDHISVMEVEDFTNFDLGENLLVLTTFSFIQCNEKKMLQIIKKLSQKNISGLIVKLNRFIQNIPSDILDFANNNNLPVLIIDNDIPFRSIINHVYQLIIHKQYDTIFQMNNMYKSLYSSLMTDITIEDYIKRLGISDEKKFYIETQDGILYSSPSLVNSSDPTIYDYDEADGYHFTKRVKFDGFEEVAYKKEFFLIFPIKNALIDFGYIVLSSSSDKLTILEQMAFTQLSSYLSIKLNELRMNQKEQLTNNGRIYNELTDGSTLTKMKAESLLHSAGLTESSEYRVVFISIIDPGLSNEKFEKVKNKYASFFFDVTSKHFIGYTASGFRIIYGLDYHLNGKDPTFDNFIREIQQIFKSESIPVKLGISNSFKELQTISLAHYQAKTTILISRRVPGYEHTIFYKDIWEIDMINAVIGSSQVKELQESILKPLNENDECNKVKLMETLEAVVLKGSLKEASEYLFVHITTLRYRLDRIETLTGYNYQVNRGRFILTMAYFVYILNLN